MLGPAGIGRRKTAHPRPETDEVHRRPIATKKRTEDRKQRTENRGQRTEDRGQKTEYRAYF